jgi:hypothetical protein
MKTLKLVLLFGLILFAGCKEDFYYMDTTPPSAPQGVYTYPGDNLVEVHWLKNSERDVTGYNVYASTSLYGKYECIGTAGQNVFIDNGVTNGVTYYYAVSAFDDNGNESGLSRDIAYDTPRPEGYGVRLINVGNDSDKAGYDFSTYTTGPYNDDYTDIYFEYYNGEYYMNVWKDTDIQDMGYTNSLYTIENAPDGGWSPTKDVRLIEGHAYVVWTWNNHYAKFRVVQLSPSSTIFDWTYQLQEGNPRLKVSTVRGKLTPGDGYTARHK